MWRVKYLTPTGIQYRIIRADDLNHASRVADKRGQHKKWLAVLVEPCDDGTN